MFPQEEHNTLHSHVNHTTKTYQNQCPVHYPPPKLWLPVRTAYKFKKTQGGTIITKWHIGTLSFTNCSNPAPSWIKFRSEGQNIPLLCTT